MTVHPPTEEQEAILSAVSSTADNLMIRSYAGTGKTATLEMAEAASKTKPVLYLCFNKKNAEEATERMSSTTSVRTLNSMGHRVWAQTQNKKLALNFKKTQDILRTIIDEAPKYERDALWDAFWDIVNAVSMAKALGYVPSGVFPGAKRLTTMEDFHESLEEEPSEIIADTVDEVLFRSIQAAYQGSIDFNDQVYMPAVFGGIFPKFPLVMVDEVQDLNPTNHALLARLAKGRMIAVGDQYQSIYGFRGAVPEGMSAIATTYSCKPYELSVSFRCPEQIVRLARWRVPNFKWFKPGGYFDRLDQLKPSEIADGATFLCRNNAPLFATAMGLLSSGRSVSIAGSEIGPKLIGQMKKLGPLSMSKDSLMSAIVDWRTAREDKGSTTAADLAQCMIVFANHGRDLGQAINYAEHLFKQSGTIQLMTGHKAKGLEFPIVYHLDPWLGNGNEQDLNLRYVIQTRSMDEFYEIDSENIKW